VLCAAEASTTDAAVDYFSDIDPPSSGRAS
jgi:hypothetical protein